MSTSSDEGACDKYGGAWAYGMGSPWYPTFGQPLVYYSQVEPLCQRQRGVDNDKPNCFKKAFRWYTQEHVPFKNGRTNSSSNVNKANVKGFAEWLDEKYNEFLQSSQIERTKYILTQTSAVELTKINNRQFEQSVTKKCKRARSPWKKRKKYSNTKEKGDVIVKSSHSIEIILKPKELSCPASECCQRTKAQSCCNRSSCTVESNASTPHKVTQQKSQSLTSIEIHMIPFDIPNYLPKNNEKEHAKASNHKISKRVVSNFKNKKYRSRNISCQCSKYMDKNVDKFSQIEDTGIINQSVPCPCKSNNTEVKASLDERNDEMELVASETKLNTEPAIATYTSTEDNRAALLAPVSDSVQTSDYSINLNQNAYPEYPLFMKIVCADKLKPN